MSISNRRTKGSSANAAASKKSSNNNRNQSDRGKQKFFIPKTKQQFKTLLRRLSIQFFNVLFNIADKSMYLLGPILITVASALIVGLTFVYFHVVLPMMAGTNWVYTENDLAEYWRGRGYEIDHLGATGDEGDKEQGDAIMEDDTSMLLSKFTPTYLALLTPTGILHTSIVTFFLVNILYNYYQCVTTSNSDKSERYDRVVRELAQVTGYYYPNTNEELIECKREFERRIYEKAKRKRVEMMRAAAHDSASERNDNGLINSPLGSNNNATTQANIARNGDEESQLTSPLLPISSTTPPTASQTTATAPQQPVTLPKIHNWMLLTPLEWGYCRNSSKPKPPRSHYDHVTQSLILNMDHYCPWMFNCIGYFNYRYFFNFLCFVALALMYGTLICLRGFMHLNSHEYRKQVRASGGYQQPRGIMIKHLRENSYIPTPEERTPVAFGFMLCLCLGAAVLCLGGFHLYLVLSAQTTIEFHGNWSKRRRKGSNWKNPYSAGNWKRNWEMVYGTRYWSKQNQQQQSTNINDIHREDSDEDQYRYKGCWGILLAMLPSNREPEYLPLPIDGRLVRRKYNKLNKNVNLEKVELAIESHDLELGSSGEGEVSMSEDESDGSMSPTNSAANTSTEEFLMVPKDGHGPLVGRSRGNKQTMTERIV